MEIIDFGLSSYRSIWEKQKTLFSEMVELKSQKKDIVKEYILAGEHLPVYTLGFHGNATNMLLDTTELRRRGAELIRIERGGDITYHGPGQLIVYPIIDLERRKLGVKDYMFLLENCIIKLLESYGIKGEHVAAATGVWIDTNTPRERKICAMGVKCRRYITMHGLALNVNVDLDAFSAINPCGFINKGVTSIKQELNSGEVPLEEAKRELLNIIKNQLS